MGVGLGLGLVLHMIDMIYAPPIYRRLSENADQSFLTTETKISTVCRYQTEDP